MAEQDVWAVRSKVWLEVNGKPLMGEGRLAILEAIGRHGSVRAASKETGVSYRRIRGAIHDMEITMGVTLVETHRGGGAGGGAALTEAALQLMDRFKRHVHGIQEMVDERFTGIFSDFFWLPIGKNCPSPAGECKKP